MSFVLPDGSAFRKVSGAGKRDEIQRTHVSSDGAGTLFLNLLFTLCYLKIWPQIGTLNGSFSTLVMRRDYYLLRKCA